MRLGINYMEKNVKNTNTWRLNNMLLNNQETTEEMLLAQKQKYRSMEQDRKPREKTHTPVVN